MDDPTQNGLGIHTKDNHIKMRMRGIVCYTNTRVPSPQELLECDRIILTSAEGWDPRNVSFKISAIESAVQECLSARRSADPLQPHTCSNSHTLLTTLQRYLWIHWKEIGNWKLPKVIVTVILGGHYSFIRMDIGNWRLPKVIVTVILGGHYSVISFQGIQKRWS